MLKFIFLVITILFLSEVESNQVNRSPVLGDSLNKTITLNDVIDEHFNNITPSYISIDTEGSEYEILKSFNFVNYRPKLFTIEHNYTDLEIKIDDLMSDNKYKRVFKNLTDFDAWYVCENTLIELDY